jgi:hypothetical protein
VINHFFTCLLNRPAKFYEGNIYDIYIPPAFVGNRTTPYSEAIHKALFNGLDSDAAFMCYRFFQFLHLINGCGLKLHALQFDSRITYDLDKQPNFFIHSPYVVSIVPNIGVQVTRDETTTLQQTTNLAYQYAMSREQGTFTIAQRNNSAPAHYRQLSSTQCRIDPIDTIIDCNTDGYWEIDILVKPQKSLAQVITRTLDQPTDVFQQLFELVSETNPEYSNAFWNITDSIHKFCSVLFAQAIANEKLQF